MARLFKYSLIFKLSLSAWQLCDDCCTQLNYFKNLKKSDLLLLNEHHLCERFSTYIFFPEDGKSKSNIKTKSRNKKANVPKRPTKIERKIWSNEEKEIIFKKFKLLIKSGTLPGKVQCTQVMEEHSVVFAERKWTDLKYFVKNHLQKIKKQISVA